MSSLGLRQHQLHFRGTTVGTSHTTCPTCPSTSCTAWRSTSEHGTAELINRVNRAEVFGDTRILTRQRGENSRDRFAPYNAQNRTKKKTSGIWQGEGGGVGDSELADPIEVVDSSPSSQTLSESEE